MVTTYAMPDPSPIMHTLLYLTGARDARVELGPDAVEVQLGLAWRARIPRESVQAADQDAPRTISIGAHGWGGRWLVNTSTTGLVRLTIDPAATGRCYGVPHRLTELTVSLADPDAFLAELGVPAS